MANKKILSSQAGTTIVEAMVAMVILAITSSAIILVTLQVFTMTYSSRLKNQATTYAEQSIEEVRSYYQTNGWAAIATRGKNGTQCYVDVTSWSVPSFGYCVEDCSNDFLLIPGQNIFYRFVNVTTTGNSNVEVSSIVTWKEKGVCKAKTQVDTYFYSF